MSAYKPVQGRIFTLPFLFLGVLAVIGMYYLAERFLNGLGSVTNLNGGFPWGIWVVYDIVIGTALACGGYALALTVYVMNKGKYHPLVRPAILASLLGYAMGGLGAVIDMGRWWQFYNILLPWHMNFNSVMLEIGLCVFIYVMVLIIEFAPTFLEGIGATGLKKAIEKMLPFFIALGILLPTMHQSSLGSLLIAAGYKVTPIWQSMQLLPLLAVLSALTMGFSIVVFEASMSAVGFKRASETPLLAGLGKAIMGMLVLFLVIRFGDLGYRGELGRAFSGDFLSMMFILETALFVLPLIILASEVNRTNGKMLMAAAMAMLFGGSLYRLNAFLIGYDPGPGFSYFPSVPELMVTVGIIAIEVMAYLVLVKKLPVLHSADHA